MVLSEDEVLDGEVLWRAFKCFHPTFASISFIAIPSLQSTSNHWGTSIRRYTAPSAFVKVLIRTTVIYIVVTPWFVKNYLPRLEPWNSLLATFYSHLTVILVLSFRFHYAFYLWETCTYFRCLLLPQRKNFCRVRVPQWWVSCNPPVLHREIMARPLTLAYIIYHYFLFRFNVLKHIITLFILLSYTEENFWSINIIYTQMIDHLKKWRILHFYIHTF